MNLAAFFIYVITTTFTPGPNNLMAMSNGLHTGFRRTIKFLIGVFAGFIVVMSICAFANFAFMKFVPSLHIWLSLFGAGYMIYLAIHIMRSTPHVEEENAGLNTFKAGLSMQLKDRESNQLLYPFPIGLDTKPKPSPHENHLDLWSELLGVMYLPI
jgi:cysteine/O-acetylserine efflux protein